MAEDLNFSQPQPLDGGMIIAKGLADNIPEIITAFKEVYSLRKKESAFKAALEARCAEMQINSQNFSALIQGLTELSKSENSDETTKDMYRDMIRTLFEIFTINSKDSDSFSKYLNNQ